MKRFSIYCMSVLWLFTILLFIGSIVGLSMDTSWGTLDGTNLVMQHKTGWQLFSIKGVDYFLGHFTDVTWSGNDHWNEFSWWYTSKINDSRILIGMLSAVLLIAVPFMAVFSSLVTIRMVLAIKNPKSIEFVDAINGKAKAAKVLKKLVKANAKLLKKGKISQTDADGLLAKQQSAVEAAKAQYDSELAKWKQVRTHKSLFKKQLATK